MAKRRYLRAFVLGHKESAPLPDGAVIATAQIKQNTLGEEVVVVLVDTKPVVDAQAELAGWLGLAVQAGQAKGAGLISFDERNIVTGAVQAFANRKAN